jgi:cytochrome c peroxidase
VIGVTCWPVPEHPAGVDHRIGNLGLTPDDEAAIVAFLATLSDTAVPQAADAGQLSNSRGH